MTLRDYFAAKAMCAYMLHVSNSEYMLSQSHDEISKESYRIADAMLAARDRKEHA